MSIKKVIKQNYQTKLSNKNHQINKKPINNQEKKILIDSLKNKNSNMS